jgi:glucose-1-phosphate thymidylyltransferase
VKAIVLAGGYATRLRPLTDRVAKPLLPVGGRPLVDWILERIEQIPEVDGVHVVTNSRFAADFERWVAGRPVEVHDDGTTSNRTRLGAIGDVRLVVERAGLQGDDLLVVAGDNLFDTSLAAFVGWWRGREGGSALGLYDVGDLALARSYGVVELDDDDRVVAMVEKPDEPRSTLAATATYLYRREHVPLLERYLAEGNSPDQPGRFVVWLHTRVPVYGYRFEGEWIDIGDPGQLLEADNRLRERVGLPVRAEYALE